MAASVYCKATVGVCVWCLFSMLHSPAVTDCSALSQNTFCEKDF